MSSYQEYLEREARQLAAEQFDRRREEQNYGIDRWPLANTPALSTPDPVHSTQDHFLRQEPQEFS